MKLLCTIALLATGCTLTPLTEEEAFEREYRRAETYQEWVDCQKIVAKSGGVWYSSFHASRRMRMGKDVPRHLDMVMDMGKNRCEYIFRVTGYK